MRWALSCLQFLPLLPGQSPLHGAAVLVWLHSGKGRHYAITCMAYVLLEELLHKQMHLCALDHLQRRGEIQELGGGGGMCVWNQPRAPNWFSSIFIFCSALCVRSTVLGAWVGGSLSLLVVQLNFRHWTRLWFGMAQMIRSALIFWPCLLWDSSWNSFQKRAVEIRDQFHQSLSMDNEGCQMLLTCWYPGFHLG